MPSNFKTFKKNLLDHAPAPHWETSEYQSFANIFMLVAFGVAMVLPYATLFQFDSVLDDASLWLMDYMPFLKARLMFLEALDGHARNSFTATALSGFVLTPILLIVNSIGYWQTVVCRRCRKIGPLTFVSMIYAPAVFYVLCWIAFVDVPRSFQSRYPGTARILL